MVFGLIPIHSAISLLLSPFDMQPSACFSRIVKLNLPATASIISPDEEFLCKSKAKRSERLSAPLCSSE